MDSITSPILTEVIAVASPLIKTIVDTFVKPKLEAFRDRNLISEHEFLPSDENFQEYYHRTFKKLIVINTLVFNNSQKLLTDIYVPLTIRSTGSVKIFEKIIGYPTKISDRFGNVLITDTAGMGKSTLMKYIFIDLITKKEQGIPIFIELRRLNKEKKLLQEIQEQLNSINRKFRSDLLLELMAEGGFIFILDGYDEISLSDRDVVTKDLQEFISKASNNKYFITSRPEKALTCFGSFQEFKIEPLNKKEAFELIRKYDVKKQISTLLIKKLQEKDLANINEFLSNPLLVSLLYTAFEHKQTIPFKKYLFYRQVYDANFETHDLTKGESYSHDKYSKLEIDDFHRVLRHLGFICFKKQINEFTKDELLDLISTCKDSCVGLSFNNSDFLMDLINTVPLFTKDGNYYRWSHKSLQEYFAAQFIYIDSKIKQNDILYNLYNHANLDKFINVIDLYYDMDYKTFSNVIELALLEEFEIFYNKSFKNNYNGISENIIEERIELTFLTDCFLFKVTGDEDIETIDGVKLNKMFKKYIKDHGLENDGFIGILARSNFDITIYCVYLHNNKNKLLRMLANKNNNIVKNINHINPSITDLTVQCYLDKDYSLRKLSDSNSDELNSVQNFKKMNNLIKFTRFEQVVIDCNNAFAKLAEIRKSIQIDMNNDFFL